MENKVYNITLPASGKEKELIEDIRLKTVGMKLVDFCPPHVSIQPRFSLRENVSEEDVIEVLKKFKMAPTFFVVKEWGKFVDARVLLSDESTFKEEHKKLNALLQPLIHSEKPEFEGDNFRAHLNVIRDSEEKFPALLDTLPLKQIRFSEFCFYAYDAAPVKKFGYAVWSNKLSL